MTVIFFWKVIEISRCWFLTSRFVAYLVGPEKNVVGMRRRKKVIFSEVDDE
jgi:hypothetical protein